MDSIDIGCFRAEYFAATSRNIKMLFSSLQLQRINQVQDMQNYQVLPVRKQSKLRRAEPQKYITNFYQIRFRPDKSMIYQYSIDFDPILPNDSTQKMNKIIRNVQKELVEKVGFIASRGAILYGTKSDNKPVIVCSQLKEQGYDDEKYELVILKTNSLKLEQMIRSDQENERAAALQAININTKQRLKSLGMADNGKGKFYIKEKQEEVPSSPFKVLKGYKFTSVCLNAGLFLQVDSFSRVIRRVNVYEEILKCNGDKKMAQAMLKGKIAIAMYGNYRTYQILGIDFVKCPMTKFQPRYMKQPISYQRYIERKYDIDVLNNTQPMILSISHVQKRMNKDKKIEKIPHYVYLVPELLNITGLTEDQKKDYGLMYNIATKTKLSCEKRMNEIIDKCDELNNNTQGIFDCVRPVEAQGYYLKNPHIIMGTKRPFVPHDGKIRIQRHGAKQKAQFNDMFIFHYQNHEDQAKKLTKTMRRAGDALGLIVKEFVEVAVRSTNAKVWLQQVNEEIEYCKKMKYPLPKMMMFVVGGIIGQQVYNELKAYCTFKLKIPTQFVSIKKIITLAHKNNLMSYASNILLQMNQKMGSTIWSVEKDHPEFHDRKVMVGGFSISKVNKKNSLAFVGSTDLDLTKIYNETSIGFQYANLESHLETMYENWIKAFYLKNDKKFVPETIIIYREGISKSQLSRSLKRELETLQKLKESVRAKTPFKNYSPEILYILVNKYSNSKFFEGDLEKKKFNNPYPGGVIVDSLSETDFFEFHLTPHPVDKTMTSSPTHFTVCYHEKPRLSREAIIELTHEQCYNYYNWKGAIKFPACLQNANKLAKMSIKALKEDIKPETAKEICEQYHFL